MMKAISVRQPWAWLIVGGHKNIENRSRNTKFRGRVLIHASQTMTDNDILSALDICEEQGVQLPDEVATGAIVGMATIVDVVTQSTSPWFAGEYGYVLSSPVALPPIQCKGALGFWNFPGLNTAQVAEYLRKEPVTIRSNAQRLNVGQKIGRDWIFDWNDIDRIASIPAPGRPR